MLKTTFFASILLVAASVAGRAGQVQVGWLSIGTLIQPVPADATNTRPMY